MSDVNNKQIQELINIYKAGNLDLAKSKVEETIELHPDSFVLFNLLGAILNGQKKYAEAVNNFKMALKINPNYAEAENNLGITYQKMEKFNKSILCFKRALKLRPNLAEAYNNLGVIFKKKGNFDESIFYLKNALKIRPMYSEALEALGAAYLYLNKHKEGLQLIAKGSGFIRFDKNNNIKIINTLYNAKN